MREYPPAWRRTAFGRAGRQSSAAASPRAKKPLRGFFAKPSDGRSAGCRMAAAHEVFIMNLNDVSCLIGCPSGLINNH